MTLSGKLGEMVSQLSQTNVELWHTEDKARLPDDHTVAQAKRKIDQLNQRRNDLIEKIDVLVLEMIGSARAPRHG